MNLNEVYFLYNINNMKNICFNIYLIMLLLINYLERYNFFYKLI